MDLNLLRILIDSDKNRKEKAFMLYHFWQNDKPEIDRYLVDYAVKDGLFTKESAKVMPKIHRDITNKVLNNLCTAYSSGVDRYLVDDEGNVNDEQTELLNDIYKTAGIIQAQNDWYKSGKLFNCVEVKVVWRDDKLQFDLWTPNWFSVWENPQDKYVKDLILFDIILKDKNGQEVEAQEVWTKDEHYYLIENGFIIDPVTRAKIKTVEKRGVHGDDTGNSYKIIPSAELRFKKGEDYYGKGLEDLVEDNIWHDIQESNLVYVQIIQGMGILYSVNMGKSGTIAIRPNSILAVNDVKADEETPFIDSVATNAPITELQANLKENQQNILLMKGLSGNSATVDNDNAPGISKAIDNEELDLLRLNDRDLLIDFESRLYEVVRTVYNTHSGTQLNENLTFVCEIIDKVTSLNEMDTLKKWEFEFKHGLKSKVDYLLSENPNLTQDQAEQMLKDNEETEEPETEEETETIEN